MRTILVKRCLVIFFALNRQPSRPPHLAIRRVSTILELHASFRLGSHSLLLFFRHNRDKPPANQVNHFRRCSLSRMNSSVVVPSLALLLLVSGCQKSTDQSATPDSASSSSPSGAPGGPNNRSSSGKSSIREAFTPKPLVVPAETTITVVLDEPLSSKTSETGQNFSATVSSPIEIDGNIAIPKGALATGVVREAKSAGRFKGGAVLALALSSITVNSSSYEVQTSNHSPATKANSK